MTTLHRFSLAFDHFQFYLSDRAAGLNADTSTMWNSKGSMGTVAGVTEIVGIATVRYGGLLELQLRIASSVERLNDSWTILGEFELDVPSGLLLVWAPETADDTDDERTVEVSPGRYAGAAYVRNAESVKSEMEPVGEDRYDVALTKV